jgi:tetratricopeptide (TPR) repeat protein
MSISYATVQDWLDIPMGPQTQMFLGHDAEAKGMLQSQTEPSPERLEAFSEFLRNYIRTNPMVSETELVNLMEELTQMKLADHAILLHESNLAYDLNNNFRGLLALGSAAMLANELSLAESSLRRAQAIVPEEPSPYINLTQIFFAQERDDEALKWALAGLEVDLNNFRLWESVALVYQAQEQSTAGERLRALAEKKNSWAGLSLAAMLIDPDDRMLRAQLLEGLYDTGVRDIGFLVEYTAALGASTQYEKIPQIVWSARVNHGDGLGWRLLAHGAQAHLASDQFDQAISLLDQALQDALLPQAARAQLEQLKNECIASIQPISEERN